MTQPNSYPGVKCCNVKRRHNVLKLCGRPPQYAPHPASWLLMFWPWKWCPSHVWRGLTLCQFWYSFASLFST